MRTAILISVLTALFSFSSIIAQETEGRKKSLPSVEIRTLNGATFNTGSIDNKGKPIIISFWATWCKPCLTELNTIAEIYEDWQEETGVLLIAVSIDNTRSSAGVAPLVNGNGWEYLVLMDTNHDLKRAMGVNLIPHTFILNSDKEVVWEHTSFSAGGELEMFEILKKVNNAEKID